MTEFHPKKQTPEEVADGLRDAMREQQESMRKMKEKFPEFDTIESKLRYKYAESIYVKGNMKQQGTSFNTNFNSKYNKAYNSLTF
jgi:hypothetical protein